MLQPLEESHKYRRWIGLLKENGLDIHGVAVKHTRYRHNGEALFGLVELNATTPEGDKIPPICFIKGEVVSIVIALIEEETSIPYLLLVSQRRICSGGLIYEHVAGIVDMNDIPHEVAVREAQEEAGITLDPARVYALNDSPYFPSTGTSDEAMYFFYTEIPMSREQIKAMDQRQTGLLSEHERISTHVATIAEAKKRITNTNALLNLYLYLEATGR